MLKATLPGLAVGVVLVAVSATSARADVANSRTEPSLSSPQATASCNSAVCAVEADDVKSVAPPVPVSATGQPLYICRDVPVPADLVPKPDPHQGEPGRWVERKCTQGEREAEGTFQQTLANEFVWQPSAQPSVEALAKTAYQQLKPPAPALALSPPPEKPEVVGMQLWLAVSPSIWKPIMASAAAGAASATVTATPEVVTWSMGDGHSVMCHGPGTLYPTNATAKTPTLSPTCGYTYPTSSSAARNAAFPVIATVRWHVEWSGSGGLKGSFADLRSTASTEVKVVEVRALVTEVDR